jgi:hypothetical protein
MRPSGVPRGTLSGPARLALLQLPCNPGTTRAGGREITGQHFVYENGLVGSRLEPRARQDDTGRDGDVVRHGVEQGPALRIAVRSECRHPGREPVST